MACSTVVLTLSAAIAVGGATSGAVVGALDIPAGFGNNTAATVVEVPSAIEQVHLVVDVPLQFDMLLSVLSCC